MISRSEITRLERGQNRILSAASSDLRQIFGSLDLSRPQRARDGLLELYPAVVDQYGDISATAAAEWYEDARRSQHGGTYAAVLAALPAAERLTENVRWAAGGLFADDPMSALSLLDGSMTRALGDLSRDTISENTKADQAAVGWHRIARADGCDFCVTLSQRGAVYKRETATFASHDNCRCRAAPSWDPSAPEVDVMAYEASDRMESLRRRASDPSASPEDRARAQGIIDRQRQRVNEWMDANRGHLDSFRAELT